MEAFILAHVVYPDDARVIQIRHDTGFIEEPLAEISVLAKLAGQDLQRIGLLVVDILGKEHLAMAPVPISSRIR
jgi:hypothetical protein